MPTDSAISEELRAAIGVESVPAVHEVSKSDIARFARAIDDPNPLYIDETHARNSRYGRIVAPPTFLRSMEPPLPNETYPIAYPEVLDGGSQWEYFDRVRAGDTITVATEITDLKERKGSLGPMLFVVRETGYTNQTGRPVALQRSTYIYYRAAGGPS